MQEGVQKLEFDSANISDEIQDKLMEMKERFEGGVATQKHLMQNQKTRVDQFQQVRKTENSYILGPLALLECVFEQSALFA